MEEISEKITLESENNYNYNFLILKGILISLNKLKNSKNIINFYLPSEGIINYLTKEDIQNKDYKGLQEFLENSYQHTINFLLIEDQFKSVCIDLANITLEEKI